MSSTKKKITPKQAAKKLKLLIGELKLIENIKIVDLFIEQALEEQADYLSIKTLSKQEYRYRTRFKISPRDLPNIKGYDKLLQFGYYNKDTNPNGVVKDHRYSIKNGLENNIEPETLGQLHNCEFLTFQENLQKSSKSSITLTELMQGM